MLCFVGNVTAEYIRQGWIAYCRIKWEANEVLFSSLRDVFWDTSSSDQRVGIELDVYRFVPGEPVCDIYHFYMDTASFVLLL